MFSYYGPGIGKELENIVYLEALRNGRKVYVGRQKTKEIDFIIERGKERIYIQVCYLLTTPEVVQREF